MTPEFSRVERVEAIGDQPRIVTIEANAEEGRRLAARFALIAIDRLSARFTIWRDAAGVRADGLVTAAVVQACSVTGDPIVLTLDEAVTLRFAEPSIAAEEVELSGDALDVIEITGGAIDLGEVAAETMALTLDPFPRGPGAAAALKAAGIVGEEAVGPFAALAALKQPDAG